MVSFNASPQKRPGIIDTKYYIPFSNQSTVKQPLQDISGRILLVSVLSINGECALKYFVHIFHSKTKVGVYFSDYKQLIGKVKWCMCLWYAQFGVINDYNIE